MRGVSVLKQRYILLFQALWFIIIVCTFKGVMTI